MFVCSTTVEARLISYDDVNIITDLRIYSEGLRGRSFLPNTTASSSKDFISEKWPKKSQKSKGDEKF